MTISRFFILLLLCCQGQHLAAQEQPVEIKVTGKQPGPPMWRVSNGGNELWIFASIDRIPEGMIWESDKVEAVIARAEEYIERPDIDLSASPLVMLNPVNLVRGYRLARRVSANPYGDTLEESLPADMYQRFSALKSEYFSRDKKIEKQRPMIAANQMSQAILEEEGLVNAESVQKKLNKLARKNRSMQRTPIQVKMKLEGGFGDIAERVENLMASISREQELNCFNYHLRRMERDLEGMKYRADSWARGYIDDFIGAELPGDLDDPCTQMMFVSSEQQTIEGLLQQVNELWLSAAVNALETRKTSFAVLGISDLLREDGYLSKLRERGYEIRIP